jgi:hypothetical protein
MHLGWYDVGGRSNHALTQCADGVLEDGNLYQARPIQVRREGTRRARDSILTGQAKDYAGLSTFWHDAQDWQQECP